jgi:hypothetical protein
MNPKSEQALVGLFVIVATAVLIGTVFAISGAFGRSTHTYRAFFPFAGVSSPARESVTPEVLKLAVSTVSASTRKTLRGSRSPSKSNPISPLKPIVMSKS